jgi:hypothetical protein
MPEGYSRIDVKENRDLYYSFAIINKDKSMEIRFSTWSLIDDFEAYEASLKDSNVVMINPNNMYRGIIQANALNMTGGNLPDIGAFPDDAVKKEFNADKGGSCFFRFNCGFGEGYTYGQFVYLHKDNLSDVIVTFMSNDIDRHADNMNVGFYALTFK